MRFVILGLFVLFMVVLVVGFNRQMLEKNAKRDEIKRKIKDRKNETTH